MNNPRLTQFAIRVKALSPAIAQSLAKLSQVTSRLRAVGIAAIAALLLVGCVDYDVAIHVDNPNQGVIIQHIQVGERFQNLSGDAAQQWVKTIRQQTKRLGGQVQNSVGEGLVVKIPFNNSAELAQKFNQFFDGILKPNPSTLAESGALPTLKSKLTVDHSNFLLVERHHLYYTLDLRSLGVLSSQGEVLVSPSSLIKLQFKLETPWGSRPIVHSDQFRSTVRQVGRSLLWNPIPGEQNQLEAIFWLPSPLGIGAGIILLLILLGKFLKYPQSPQPSTVLSNPVSLQDD